MRSTLHVVLSAALLNATMGTAVVTAQEQAAGPATVPSEHCDYDTVRKLVSGDVTVAFVAREGYGGCRVNGYIATTGPGPGTNRVQFVVQMPDNFNGRLVYLGVGGAAGQLPVMDGTLLRQGYALAGGDSGTGAKTFADFSFKSDPVKHTDFLWRGVRSAAAATQAITRGYYNRDKISRLISGCSGGGQMGLSNAIRFGGESFDGFISAATVWPGAAFKANAFTIAKHIQTHPDAWISPEMLQRAHKAFIERYDDADGARDGIIHDARNIRNFDFNILREVGFTTPQIETMRMITSSKSFSGPGVYKDGMQAGWPVTDVGGWVFYLTGKTPPPWPNTTTHSTSQLMALGAPYYHIMADTNLRAIDPKLDYTTVNDPRRMVALSTRDGTETSTNDLDLSKLDKSGAKLIIWHGAADDANSYLDNLRGYEEVLAKYPNAKDWFRFFVVPGLHHCNGGSGPTDMGPPMIDALGDWVETGKPPEKVDVARMSRDKGVERVFRLCPEPLRSVLKSPGLDPKSADNWECRKPVT